MRSLEQALGRRDEPLDLFFRDDDAGWDMDALDRLLELLVHRNCPVDVAVIPAALDTDLATNLSLWRVAHPGLGLHQHGYSHENHEGPDARKCEFGSARSVESQTTDIAVGRQLLGGLIGDLDPIFTPPWNRCALTTVQRLPALGFRMMSADAAGTAPVSDLCSLPITFDWDRARREDRLEVSLAQQIEHAAGPVGIMLHHATLDADARARLGDVVGMLCASDTVRLRNMRHWLA